jgi:antitoxin component YwqK of YwqJK toxin-antitoxin module
MRLLPFFLLLLLTACSNLETVEDIDENGQKIRFQRRKNDFAREGLYQRFSADGKLLEEVTYAGDSLHGERKFFYPNGAIEQVETFRMGVYHGPYRKYYESGKIQLEQTFENGAMQGQSIRYYENGNIAEKVTIVNNEENGPFTEYYENGKIAAEGAYATVRGESAEEGELKEYDENGTLIRIADCKRGVCLTRWKKE